jgi:cobalt/nickel transport system permease protein
VACDHFFRGDSFVHKLDPRVRIVTAFVFSSAAAVSPGFPVPVSCLAFAFLLSLLCRLPLSKVGQRLKEVNIFMILIVGALPFSTPGTPLFQWGFLSYTREGLSQALLIAVKGNAVVLLMTLFLATMDAVKLGHALSRLNVPDKLTHLFLFTVRYIDVLEHEYRRLITAMKMRCFQPKMNLHTYRSLAYLVAMLLVKSFDRSHRILAAMKCRGFQGKFYVLEDFALSRADLTFCVSAFAVFTALVWKDWL